MKDETWVTIAAPLKPIDAQILKGKLESEGIEVRLLNENIMNLYPLAGPAIGGTPVQVRQKDFAEAIKVYNRTTDGTPP